MLKISISPISVRCGHSAKTTILPTSVCPFRQRFCQGNNCSFFNAISDDERLKNGVVGVCFASVALQITSSTVARNLTNLDVYSRPLPGNTYCPLLQAACIYKKCARFKPSPSISENNLSKLHIGRCMAFSESRVILQSLNAFP